MKINGNAIRPGNVLELRSQLWIVSKIQHTQPGKGGAYMQVEMKSFAGGTKLNERFRSSEQVERVFLEEIEHQYLYKEDENFIFMHPSTYEQIPLSNDFVGELAPFLQDNMMVNICFYDGKPVSLKLPDNVTLSIVEAEPVVKGQTASSSFKPAKLENGMRIMVPPHIEAGTRIVVNTADSSYVERAKS